MAYSINNDMGSNQHIHGKASTPPVIPPAVYRGDRDTYAPRSPDIPLAHGYGSTILLWLNSPIR